MSTSPVSFTVTTTVVTTPACCSKGAPWVLAAGVLGWERRWEEAKEEAGAFVRLL
jgi:hypothetical protein